MKAICATLLSLLITGSKALASTGGAGGENIGLLATFFIAFGVLVLLLQFIPGLVLFSGIVKGIFYQNAKKPEQGVEAGGSNH